MRDLLEKDLIGSIGGAIAKSVGAKLKASYSYCIDKDTGATLEVAVTSDSGKKTHEPDGDEVRDTERLRLHAARNTPIPRSLEHLGSRAAVSSTPTIPGRAADSRPVGDQ